MSQPEESQESVYLEDIEVQAAPKKAESSSNEVATPSSSQKSDATANNKRQRTLMDMFGGGGSQPSSKKLKTTTTTIKSTTTTGTKNLRLNAIPFSLAQFQDSLTPDQKGLLALECVSMGKSWYVFNYSHYSFVFVHYHLRLKLLKDEIKKPYFIALKKFLWEEGVRGPDDIPKSLKVYPSRTQSLFLSPEFAALTLTTSNSEQHLRMVQYPPWENKGRDSRPRSL